MKGICDIKIGLGSGILAPIIAKKNINKMLPGKEIKRRTFQ